MLISRRKEGETLLIGGEIEVRVVAVRGKKVTLGVVAPRELKISTGKLSPAALANTLAAALPASVDMLVQPRGDEQDKPVSMLQPFSHEEGPSDR